MPVKKAAYKHVRQTKKRTVQNKTVVQNVRYLLKNTRAALANKDKAKAVELNKKTVKALDKAVQHHVLKKNTASRYKSRLQQQINKLK